MWNSTPHRRRQTLARVAAIGACAAVAAALCGWAAWGVAPFFAFVSRAALAGFACTAAAGAALLALFACEERRRRERVACLAERVDRIVRDPTCVQDFCDYEEGELAVLANELQKVCTLLRDQAGALRCERDALADSLANISHQLRTPLSSMGVSLELLGEASVSPERRRALLRELQGQAEHMGWLVSSLLALARSDAGTLQLTRARVEVSDLVERAVAPLRIACELKGVALETCSAGADVCFEGDAGWSREALANVVKNCMEHTPAGGTVRVAAMRDALATRIVVSDTGSGIAPSDLPRLFERFYKGEGSAPGSAGVGLALARCLVAAQGGTLAASNAPQGGARFTFTFPHTVV